MIFVVQSFLEVEDQFLSSPRLSIVFAGLARVSSWICDPSIPPGISYVSDSLCVRID